jgi:hypothetical protein
VNGAQALITTLVGNGVRVCFANPGTSEMHFVAALDAVDERNLQKNGAIAALGELRYALRRISEQNRGNQAHGQTHMLESLEHLTRALRTLGLTEIQEIYVDGLLKEALDEARHYFDEAQNIESEFSEVLNQLERLARADY